MHATKYLTPEVLLWLAFGMVIFIVVFRAIFRKGK